MKKLTGLSLAALLAVTLGGIALAEPVGNVTVEGNETVKAEHILSAVSLKPGMELDQTSIREDTKKIYEMGYFDSVDAKISGETGGHPDVIYLVKENPVIQDITFSGNTIYKEEELKKLLFSKPGMVFNHLFFQNDLQRLRDKFQSDGYVMTQVKDVSIDGGHVHVTLGEAHVGEVIIQGNRRTKKQVIQRYFPIKSGDLFNAVTLRHSVARIRSLGFLDDVTVGFEPTDDPNKVNLVINVREKKSASLLFSVSYGSSSGFGGGVSYKESNLAGLGQTAEVGFEKGGNTNYWLRLADPYMDKNHLSWKVGGYHNEDKGLLYRYHRYNRFYYDEKRLGAYIGGGKKFGHEEKYSWFLTADWHSSKIDTSKYVAKNVELLGPQADAIMKKYYLDKDSLSSKVFTTTLEVTRDNTDRYLPYSKGDIETVGIEKAWPILGSNWSYAKYWAEAKFYHPVDWLRDYVTLGINDDRPAIFAVRVRAAGSSGTIPLSEQYTIGGDRTVRGYPSGYERGSKMVLGNFELRVPIDDNVGLVAFYDIGRVWNELEGDPFVNKAYKQQKHWLSSPGVGIRLNTPIGQVRLDVAQGKDVNGKTETQYQFGFGEMF